ncbi:hypothetical protein L249_7024, partial [Ophiocordyceps polyrhachis-furcata BCC 54312]
MVGPTAPMRACFSRPCHPLNSMCQSGSETRRKRRFVIDLDR